MDAIFSHSEKGKLWPWYYYIAPVYFLLVYLIDYFNYSIHGTRDAYATILVLLCVVGIIIFLIQVSIAPRIVLKVFKDRIEILSLHANTIIKRWTITQSQIGNISLICSPYKEIEFEDPFRRLDYPVKRIDLKRTEHAIAVNSHTCAIYIESLSQNWLIGLIDSERVFNILKSTYKEPGILNISKNNSDSQVIEIFRIQQNDQPSVPQRYLIFQILLYLPVCLLRPYNMDYILDYQIGFIVLLFVIGLLIFIPFMNKKPKPMLILRATKECLEIREQVKGNRMISIKKEQLLKISTVYVEFGNYRNIPEFIEGCRMQARMGSHTALAVCTAEKNWAFDVIRPEKVAEALRKIYDLDNY